MRAVAYGRALGVLGVAVARCPHGRERMPPGQNGAGDSAQSLQSSQTNLGILGAVAVACVGWMTRLLSVLPTMVRPLAASDIGIREAMDRGT